MTCVNTDVHQEASQTVSEAARPVYPFTAIIGQEEMKFAALMNIIDPNIGGIMVMGDRGTGKSTTVRSLVQPDTCLLHTKVRLNLYICSMTPFNYRLTCYP